jgi:putative nucleotidyltransferase with HDIG domain
MKILYVEPESTTREFITEMISQDNTEVEVCTSSAEALQFLDFEVYDLIITDFRLPQNGGVNILRKLIKNKQYPKLVYFSSVRPRKSKNLRKLLRRQNIFYVPRGMTSISIDGLSKEINNYEPGLFQRMFEVFMFKKSKGLNKDKMVVKQKKKKKKAKADNNDEQKVKNLLDVDIEEGGEGFGNSVEDFGTLDLGDSSQQEEVAADWGFETTRTQEELEADWEMFQKKGMAINELDYGFSDKEYQEETEADWGTVDSNNIKDFDDLDEDEGEWLKPAPADQDADWSIKKGKAGEEELDFTSEHDKQADEQADWEIGNEDAGTIDADWKIKGKKGSEVYADWEVSGKDEEEDNFPDYVGIAFSRLKALNKAPCDIYFRLGDRKMLKMVNENDDINEDFFAQMEEKGAKEMFLKKAEFNQFDDVFGDMLNKKLKSAKVSKVEKIQVMGSQLGFDYVHKQMQAIGISDSTAKVAQSTVENTLEVVLKDRNLLSSLKEILMGKSYISEHSIMAVTISTEILRKLGWMGSGNVDKIAMAGLFHDSLIPDDRMARLNRASQLNDLSNDEKQIVLNHAEAAAKKLEESKFVDQDVFNIVKNHHERPQGEGFPGGLQPQALSNLTCIFILAEELVELLYTYKFDVLKARRCWESDYEFFNIGNFKKPLDIAKNIL